MAATNLSIFGGAMLPSAPVILGRQLLPLSCWHALLLMMADSPWLRSGTAPDWADTVFALWVCGRRYEAEDSANWDRIQSECVAWGRAVGEWNHDAVSAEFREYLDAALTLPGFKQPATGEAASPIPWPFRAVATVMHYLPQLSEEDAWNLPVARVACYRACCGEDNGMELVDDTTRAIIARARAAGAL